MAYFSTEELKILIMRHLKKDQWTKVSELSDIIYPKICHETWKDRRQYSCKIGQVLTVLRKQDVVESSYVKDIRAWKRKQGT